MYHVGRVVELFSSEDKNVVAWDNSTQALLDMWDENLITLAIDPHISRHVKKNDILLVDYSQTRTGPKMLAVKVLRGDVAKKTWDKYKQHFEKVRNMKVPKGSGQSYVG